VTKHHPNRVITGAVCLSVNPSWLFVLRLGIADRLKPPTRDGALTDEECAACEARLLDQTRSRLPFPSP
jgi:hypothetical protein